MKEPGLKEYINRYEMDKKLLEKHPEHKTQLENRIENHKEHILEIITTEKFKNMLDVLNI